MSLEKVFLAPTSENRALYFTFNLGLRTNMVIKFLVVPPAPADVPLSLCVRPGDSDTWQKGHTCRKECALSAWVIRINAPEPGKASRTWENGSVVRERFLYEKHGEFKLLALM